MADQAGQLRSTTDDTPKTHPQEGPFSTYRRSYTIHTHTHTDRSPSLPFSFCHAPLLRPSPKSSPTPDAGSRGHHQHEHTRPRHGQVSQGAPEIQNPFPPPFDAGSKRQRDIASAPSCPGDGGGRGTMQSIQIQHHRVGRKKDVGQRRVCFLLCFAWVRIVAMS